MAKILIVEDDAIMRNIVSRVLVNLNHEVIGRASNGEDGLKMYNELKPEVVTMDIQMESGDGVTCMQKIIQSDPKAKVIMVSARSQERKIQDMLKIGATGYIIKPFKVEDFQEAIQVALTEERNEEDKKELSLV